MFFDGPAVEADRETASSCFGCLRAVIFAVSSCKCHSAPGEFSAPGNTGAGKSRPERRCKVK